MHLRSAPHQFPQKVPYSLLVQNLGKLPGKHQQMVLWGHYLEALYILKIIFIAAKQWASPVQGRGLVRGQAGQQGKWGVGQGNINLINAYQKECL